MKHYGVSQGLPSSECYWVTQDSKGYLWIGTDAGVVKYDGYKFKTYNSSKGLPDNTVFKIHEDKYGRIWFATYSGQMAYYSHKTDSIYGIKGNQQIAKLIKIVPSDFAFDDKDTLFISASRNGYIKISPPNYDVIKAVHHKTEYFFLKRVGSKNFIYGNKFDISPRLSENVPIVFEDEYVDALKDTTFKIPGFVNHVSALKKDSESYLFSDSRWIFEISKGEKKIVYTAPPLLYEKIVTLNKDSYNRVWVNTIQNGTFLFENFNFNKEPRQFLNGLSVTSVFEDSDHGIWLTTLEDGIFYLPTLNFMFINQTSGFEFDKVPSIYINNNYIYCLSAKGFVNKIDLNTLKSVGSLEIPRSLTYLYGYNDKLIVCSNISDIVTTDFKSTKALGGHFGVRFKKVFEYNDDFLLGCCDGTILKLNKSTAETTFLCDGFPTIFSIHVMNGVIWIGTKTGLYSLFNGKLKFHGNEIPILKNRVEDMAHIGDKLYLATRGYGVLCLDNNKITHQYNESNGLASNMCKSIIADEDGNLWVGTNRGISRLKKVGGSDFSVNTINLSKGLVSNEINQLIKYKDKLYFATNKGLGVINVNDAFNPAVSIPVYIESFSVSNIKRDFFRKHKFNHEENFVQISFKGVYVKAEGDIKYKYRLEGLDTTWTYSKNTFIQFTTLPPGDYKFVVYAVNTEGKASYVPAIVQFTINTPFWKTYWFILIVVGVVLVGVYIIYSRRVLFIEKQEKEKTEYNKMIAESELKALRAQMNPHFMFNAINSIQSFVLKNDSRSAQKYLTKFARLIRSVLENSKYDFIPLSKEVETLDLYIELECLRSSFSFDYEIVVNEPILVDTMQIPPMLIQPYIENAILHGLTPLIDKRGNLIVEFSQEGSVLKCAVEDNGIGREKAAEIRSKKQSAHQSMGMSVTEDRLTILNKNNHFKSNVLVIDKTTNGIPSGTRVEIYLEQKK